MDPVSILAIGAKVFGFIRRNWALVLLAGVALWGGWQYLGKIEAENALATQQMKILEDDNATWAELNVKREKFEEEVRAGFARLSDEVAKQRADNAAFQSKVNANANSKRPLDPVERAALGMLSNSGGNKAGGGADQPPAQRPPM